MPPYDSDSSEGEEDYTETNVLLGYASKEATDDAISHLGGYPAWLDEKTAPSGSLAKCKVCNDLLSLMLELNGDLPERFPGHERRLYLLGCRRKACRRKAGSIRGFRAIRSSIVQADLSSKERDTPSAPAQTAPPKQHLGSSIFGAQTPSSSSFSSNPFSPSASISQAANPFASASSLAAKPPQRTVSPPPPPPSNTPTPAALAQTFAEKARISAPPSTQAVAPIPATPWPSRSSFPKPYPHYSLDADYETLDATPPPIPQRVRIADGADDIMDLDDSAAPGSSGKSNKVGGGAEGSDEFESAMDRTFQKFADRVGQNPEQVLRYEFGGHPLLYSKDDAVGRLFDASRPTGSGGDKVNGGRSGLGMPRCEACGAGRVFELQLAPHAITELEADEDGVEGMEWGTVILGVCERDCSPKDVDVGEVGYVEEWVGVQWEEVVKR